MDALRRRRGNRPTHDAGPEPGHRRRDRAGRLRPGRHDHVHQRDRAVPVGPAAGAVRPPAGWPSSARCCRSCPPTCGPSGGTGARSCGRSTAATPGADLAALEHFVDTELAPTILSRLSPDAGRRIREHRAAGHPTVLITGVVRPLTRPLQPLFDVIMAADLATDADGRCTGFLTGPPLVGESRAAWLQPLRRAARHRPDQELRLRGLPLRPADAVGRRQRRRGQSRRSPDAGGQRQPVVERGVEDRPDDPPLGVAQMRTPFTDRSTLDGPPRIRPRRRRPDPTGPGRLRRHLPAGAAPGRRPSRLPGRLAAVRAHRRGHRRRPRPPHRAPIR